MRLTVENTAIVLDSTADLPDAADPRPELARRGARGRAGAAELELVVALGAVIGSYSGPGTFWYRDAA